jgi:hypothetical protein
MPILSEETIRRLRATVEAMKAHPQQTNMNSDYVPHLPANKDSCGSSGCLFGWACYLFSEFKCTPPGGTVYIEGARALALPEPTDSHSWVDDHESNVIRRRSEPDRMAAALFFIDHWPTKFKKKYNKAECTYQGQAALAEIVSARVEHFIKTDGKE